jgi:tetratricopeptide (TPR) repeat protein
MQALASVDASNLEYQEEASTVLAWLADTQKALGHFDEAIALRQRQAGYLKELIDHGAADVALKQAYIIAHQGIGVLYSFTGDPQRAVQEYRIALDQANRLMAIEPANSLWKDQAANVHLSLAKDLIALGQRSDAAQEVAAGCSLTAGLHPGGSKVARWRDLQTSCLSAQARVALASGDKANSLKYAEQALASAQAQQSGNAARDRFGVAAAFLLLGDVRKSGGDSTGAMQAWQSALSAIPPNVAEMPPEMDDHATILDRVGKQSEAAPLKQRLSSIRYRRLS